MRLELMIVMALFTLLVWRERGHNGFFNNGLQFFVCTASSPNPFVHGVRYRIGDGVDVIVVHLTSPSSEVA